MRSMLLNRLKSTALAICGLSLLGLGALVAAQQDAGEGGATPPGASVAEAKGAASTLRLEGTVRDSMEFQVHSPLAGRVDKVMVDERSRVKKGQPLLEIFSTDLAAAKGEYELALSQWDHDRKVVRHIRPLAQQNQVSKKQLTDAEDTESQSRLKLKLTRDKLLIYGLTEQEIEAATAQDGREKARLTLRSPTDGLVIDRRVVPGNYFDPKDLLFRITQDDPLRVYAIVPARDIDRVEVGQEFTAILPFASGGRVKARVEAIVPSEDPATRPTWLRASIPNPDHRLKAGMSVRLELETRGRAGAIDQPPGPGEPAPGASPTDQPAAPERKPDRRSLEGEERATLAKILERLDALERKVDRLLERRERKSP